jgi:hypothetical protein
MHFLRVTARCMRAHPDLPKPNRFDEGPKPILLAYIAPLLSGRGASSTRMFTILPVTRMVTEIQVMCLSMGSPY